jgi:hypothetical protein
MQRFSETAKDWPEIALELLAGAGFQNRRF